MEITIKITRMMNSTDLTLGLSISKKRRMIHSMKVVTVLFTRTTMIKREDAAEKIY